MSIKIGKYTIAKECGGKLFPGIGYGYWDGWHYYIRHLKPKVNLKFRTYSSKGYPVGGVLPYRGFAIGPLMVWKEQ